MSVPKTISPIERAGVIDIRDNGKAIEISSLQEVVTLEVNEESISVRPLHSRPILPSRIAVIGNYLPRKCGIATFTTDLCDAIHAEYGATELLALPVNDTDEGYSYPARIRFELSQDDLGLLSASRGFPEFQQH